jgi:uncharacterized protein YceH (UPF0502 family)
MEYETPDTEPPEQENQDTGEPGCLLTFEEGRVLGCLVEKSKLTPDTYPLTLNSLLSACNQKTSRHPVTDLELEDVEEAIDGLREKKFAFRVDQAGARTCKFKHNAEAALDYLPEEAAILSILILRGPQTSGEIRTRTERQYRFSSVEEVEEVLGDMMERSDPVIKVLGSGGRGTRYHQTLAESPPGIEDPVSPHSTSATQPLRMPRATPEQVQALESRIDALEGKLQEMESQFQEIRELLE